MYVIFTINMVYAIKYMLIQFEFSMLAQVMDLVYFCYNMMSIIYVIIVC